MERRIILSRELPALDPPLVPHSLPQKPGYRLPLPRFHTHIAGEANEVNGIYLAAPFISNLRGCRDLRVEVDSAICGPFLGQASRTRLRHESESPDLISPGFEGCPVSKRDPFDNTTVSTTIPSTFTAPISPSPSSNAATKSGSVVGRSRDRTYGCLKTHRKEGLLQLEESWERCTRHQSAVSPPLSPSREGGDALVHIESHSARDSRTRSLSPTSFARVSHHFTSSCTHSPNLNSYETIRASDYPAASRHFEYQVRSEGSGSSDKGEWGGDGREWKGRNDDDRRQGEDSGGGEKGGGGGADEDDDDQKESEPRKKVPKKTAMACHFCRGRKLKCDGGRPTCNNCARRSLACAYDEYVRRRGPGRRNKKEPEQHQYQQPQASASTTSIASTLPVYRESAPPLFELPPPPPPAYPYPLGRIPGRSEELGMGQRSSQAGPSSVYGQQQHAQNEPYAQPTQQAYHTQHSQHDVREQPYQQPTYQSRYGGSYAQQYPYAQVPRYLSHGGPSTYMGGGSAAEGDIDYLSDDGDDERTSESKSKRRASTPLEEIDTTRRKRRREDDGRGRG